MSKVGKNIPDIFVKKLSEKMGKSSEAGVIIMRAELYDIWLRSGGSKSRFQYGISQAVGRGCMTRIASEVYVLGSYREDIQYWDLIARLIQTASPNGALIAGEKSLELHLLDYSVPDTLILYTRDRARRVRLSGGKEIHFRTLVSGEKTNKKNLFRILADSSEVKDIGPSLMIAVKELALLEALSLRRHEDGIAEERVLRFLKKYHDTLDAHILSNLVKYRYIRSINRLRSLVKQAGYSRLYKICLDIIRREGGGCFVSI